MKVKTKAKAKVNGAPRVSLTDTLVPRADFPLRWPAGRERIASGSRRPPRFRTTFEAAYDGLVDELGRIGAVNAAISTAVPLDGKDYLPIARLAEQAGRIDPGAAVRFERRDRAYVIACDAYQTVAGNLRAVAATLRAMREIARHGASEIMEQSMDGFRALPAPSGAEHAASAA